MSNGKLVITLKVMGESARSLEVSANSTISDAINVAGLAGGSYTAVVNGASKQLTHVLEEGQFLVLTPAVKGANA